MAPIPIDHRKLDRHHHAGVIKAIQLSRRYRSLALEVTREQNRTVASAIATVGARPQFNADLGSEKLADVSIYCTPS
jgi:hypothetical protein